MRTWFDRHATPVVEDLLAHLPGVVIEGARQVGKSSLASRLAGSTTVLTLDDEGVRSAARADPVGLLAMGRDGLLIIDEIQRLPELTVAIKAAIDADRRPGRFLVTGSASLLRLRGLTDSLAGRVARVPMYGLSRGELVGVADDFVACIRRDRDGISGIETASHDWPADIAVGSYPELHQLPTRLRGRWLDDYLAGVLQRDARELRGGADPGRLRSLLRVLAANQAGELVKARVAQDAGIPATSLQVHLDLLEALGLIALIPPWTPNLTQREVGRPKSLVLDTALAMRLSRLTVEQVSLVGYREALGSLLEGFVMAELLKQRTWSSEEFEIFHYRDRAGVEVDLVLEFSDGSVVGVEVKAAAGFQQRQFHGLQKLRDRVGERFMAGIVLNTGTGGFRHSDRLFGAPISVLWQGW